ncbi:hypothetical protein TSAR_012164 [Trichomalopsis sarcophagae]|uniref:Uncharacterized protein n=1 Tax=Trichomalopsis sarcophagae TaxID=543379 RepID=A0A232FKR6_9HYME|nr:hypothetical protein TSAR_012164 [Trichomalopsis sarcophagae]
MVLSLYLSLKYGAILKGLSGVCYAKGRI